jgi:selenide,water dikinase
MEIALKFEVHACTDITGFGILGHSLEMARAAKVQINLFYDSLPFYDNALKMYRKGESTGSNRANRDLAASDWKLAARKSREEEELLFDPQTSGGLMIAVPASQAEGMVEEMRHAGIDAAAIVAEVVGNRLPFINVV